jgi:hypothetical protein
MAIHMHGWGQTECWGAVGRPTEIYSDLSTRWEKDVVCAGRVHDGYINTMSIPCARACKMHATCGAATYDQKTHRAPFDRCDPSLSHEGDELCCYVSLNTLVYGLDGCELPCSARDAVRLHSSTHSRTSTNIATWNPKDSTYTHTHTAAHGQC